MTSDSRGGDQICFTGDARGTLGEDLTSVEEFKEKIVDQSGEHKVIICLQIGGVGLNLLVGVTFGVEYDIVRAEVVGPVFESYLVQRRRASEGASRQRNR